MSDGGPAFPSEGRIGDVPYVMTNPGMSLRDWFAGQALAAMRPTPDYSAGPGNHTIAQRAYAVADAMLAERQRTQGES